MRTAASKSGGASLIVASLGYRPPESATLEALSALSACDRLFSLREQRGEEGAAAAAGFKAQPLGDASGALKALSSGASVGLIVGGAAAPDRPSRRLLATCARKGIPVRLYAGVSQADRWLALTGLVLGHDVQGLRIAGSEDLKTAAAADATQPLLIRFPGASPQDAARRLSKAWRTIDARRPRRLWLSSGEALSAADTDSLFSGGRCPPAGSLLCLSPRPAQPVDSRNALKGARVFVTGGTGFIGSHLVSRLAAAGAELHLLVRGAARPKLNAVDPKRITLHKGDIRDAASLRRAVAAARPAFVFSLAAVRDGRDPSPGPDVAAAVALAAALGAGAPGLRRWVRTGLRLSGDFDKSAEARLDETLRADYGLSVVTLRLFRVFGPGSRGEDMLPSLIAGKRPAPPSGRWEEGPKDYVHVEDVVDAYLRAARSEAAAGRLFEIGSGKVHDAAQVALLARRALEGRRAPASCAGKASPHAADNSAARRWLRWTPKISLAQGLRRLAEASA